MDENHPRSTAQLLQESGHAATHVRDVGFSATPDNEIFDYAQSIGAIIVTRDVGYASRIDYPLGSHAESLFFEFQLKLRRLI